MAIADEGIDSDVTKRRREAGRFVVRVNDEDVHVRLVARAVPNLTN